MNEHVKEFLKYYVTQKSSRYAVMIKGKWGCGKTYFIKNMIKEFQCDFDDKLINIKPIYVSLNGLNSIESINEKIRKELHPFLHSKGVKLTKNIILGLIKSTAKINLDFDSDDIHEGNITVDIEPLKLFELDKDKVTGNRLIVFDDLERCCIKIESLFGYINTFVEHLDCKVILVSDEDRIEDRYNKTEEDLSYKNFKEKLIGHTFTIYGDYNAAIDTFIKDYENNILSEYDVNVIKDVFRCSSTHNLRILRQSISDFYRFKEFVRPYIKDVENIDIFYENIICYFIIVYLESKNGNDDIYEFQDFFWDEEKGEKSRIYIEKYSSVFTEYKIIHSSNVFALDKIRIYIENGYITSADLLDESNYSPFFLLNETKNWEKLWSWSYLEESEFRKLVKIVWDEFKNRDYSDIYQILHVYGIFLNLIKNSLVTFSVGYLNREAKKNVRVILNNEKKSYLKNSDFDYTASYSKGYHCKDSNEFKEFIDFIKSEIEIIRKNFITEEILRIFYSISNDNIGNLHKELTQLEEYRFNYQFQSILHYLNATRIVKIVKNMNSESISHFRLFLVDRFFEDRYMKDKKNREYCSTEKENLIQVKECLKYNIPKRHNIKRINLIKLIDALEAIIE